MKKILPFLIIGVLVLSGVGASAFSITMKENYDQYDMVIITPDAFISYVQTLVEHKNSHGVETMVKTTEDIYSEYNGRDKPEQIKYFIKDAVESLSISYVLLIGGRLGQQDDWYVPVRHVELDDGAGRGKFFISDLYFADLYKDEGEFEDWDKNEDDIIAQWPKDKFDLNPDVYIGRLPCRDTAEVENCVDKIIQYENNAYGQSWFNKMVNVGGDTFPDFTGYEGEITCDFASAYMQGFDITKLYYSTGAITSSSEVIDAINNGCGFFFTRAKGGTDRIRVPRSDGTEIIALNNDDIDQLSNKDQYPIMILGECQHGQFGMPRPKAKPIFNNIFGLIKVILNRFLKIDLKDNNQDPNPQNVGKECIAEKLMYKEDGGAVSVLTNSHICYAAIGDNNQNEIPDDVEIYGGFLAIEVFRLYAEENMDILGHIHAKTVENYVSTQPILTNKVHCKSVLEWILIGDPSLKIGGYQ